ncbi:hypothetical protein ACQP1G_33600 [Nocardia sp. CA-107356]|uniref:hypothetical protein n=1 Tax=Nocardia sp. CA-107356 TaxID=3239972 RepID=UPI003D924D1B
MGSGAHREFPALLFEVERGRAVDRVQHGRRQPVEVAVCTGRSAAQSWFLYVIRAALEKLPAA